MSALAVIASQISSGTYDVLLEKIGHSYFKDLVFEGVVPRFIFKIMALP